MLLAIRSRPYFILSLFHWAPRGAKGVHSAAPADLLQVLAGLPTFLLPCGFHFKACFVVSVTGFRSVCPIQAHFRLAITVGMCSCPVLL